MPFDRNHLELDAKTIRYFPKNLLINFSEEAKKRIKMRFDLQFSSLATTNKVNFENKF